MKKAAVMLYPLFSLQEISCLTELFLFHGKEIVTYAAERAPVKSEDGFTVLPDRSFQDFCREEIDCLVLPGIWEPLPVLLDRRNIAFLEQFRGDDRLVIAAISSGPLLLGKAGLLEGRRFCHGAFEEFLEEFPVLPREAVVYEHSTTYDAPDSGTTSGSRQTLITGEACRRACQDLKKALEGRTLEALEGTEYRGEYLAKTDPLGADVPNPVSHVAYGYATQICVLGEDGKIQRIVAAHDVGKAVNPISCEGQIEGGVVMSMGFALTEQYPVVDCRPTAKFGTLGLLRADQVPEVKAIVVEKPGLDVACGAIGIGEITSIPTAPAIADAYYRFDGKRRYTLPLEDTPYSRKK